MAMPQHNTLLAKKDGHGTSAIVVAQNLPKQKLGLLSTIDVVADDLEHYVKLF
jgi:hypothetical protein